MSPASTAATPLVPALIPLSLLEALRNLDTPVEDGLEELAGETVAKRLGLSATVAAQIARYEAAARRGADVAREEVVSVIRLVARREDSALVFADAGRRAARHAARLGGPRLRGPGALGRRLGGRAAVRLARGLFGAELALKGPAASASVVGPLSVEAAPDGAACGFYGSALGELLRLLVGFEGAMVHEACGGRGAAECRWRAVEAEGYER